MKDISNSESAGVFISNLIPSEGSGHKSAFMDGKGLRINYDPRNRSDLSYRGVGSIRSIKISPDSSNPSVDPGIFDPDKVKSKHVLTTLDY